MEWKEIDGNTKIPKGKKNSDNILLSCEDPGPNVQVFRWDKDKQAWIDSVGCDWGIDEMKSHFHYIFSKEQTKP